MLLGLVYLQIPRWFFDVDKLTTRIEDDMTRKKGLVRTVHILHLVSIGLEIYLFGKPQTSRVKLIVSPWRKDYLSHLRSFEGLKPPFNIFVFF